MVADNAGVLRAGLVKESSCGRVEGGMEKEGGSRPELMMEEGEGEEKDTALLHNSIVKEGKGV